MCRDRHRHEHSPVRCQILDARVEPLERVVEACARVIFAGGTILIPNDTSYCLACDPYRSQAVDRVYALKARPDHKPLTLLVASAAEFLEYAPQNPLAILASKRLLPGPVTLIVRQAVLRERRRDRRRI